MEQLRKLYDQLNHGNSELVNKFLHESKKFEFYDTSKIEFTWLQLYFLMHKNDLSKIENIINSIDFGQEIHEECKIIIFTWQLYLKAMANELETANVIYEKLEILVNELDIPSQKEMYYLYLLSKGTFHRRNNNLKDAEIVFNKLQDILPDDNYLLFNGLLANNLGAMAYISRDNYSAIPYFIKSLDYFHTLGNTEYMMKVSNNLGTAYQQLDDYQNAVFYLNDAVKFASEIQNESIFSAIQFNLGLLYRKTGDFYEAEIYFNMAKKYFSKKDDAWFLGSIEQNIGIIYDLRGEVEKALGCYNKSLDYFERISFQVGIANTYNNMGISYEKLGDLESAFKYYKESYNIRKNQDDLFELNIVIKNLYNITNELNHPSNKKFYEELQNNPEGRHSWKELATAKEYRKTKRLKKMVQAQEIYSELIDSNETFPEIKITALLELTEMLIIEYKDARQPEIILEITSLLNQLEYIAESQNSFWLQTQLLMLKSKLALLNINIIDAKKFISKAQKLAEERNYTNLAYALSNEYDTLLEDLQEIESMIDTRPDLVAELGVQGFGDIVSQVLSKKVATPEFVGEEPILLMILNEGGTAIFSSRFGGEGLNEQLIAGILSAVDSMLSEAFSASTGIERIKQKEYTLLFKPVESLIFIFVVKGSSYFAMQKLEQFIEKLTQDTEMWSEFMESIKKGRIKNETIDLMDSVATLIFE